MKKLRLICLALLTLSPAVRADDVIIPQPLTKTQADAMIRDEMNLANRIAADRLREIRAVPAIGVSKIQHGPVKTIMRRVASKPWTGPSAAEPPQSLVPSPEEMAAWLAKRPRFANVHLSATVFDGKCSEIVWRKKDVSFTILSNIDFNYMTTAGGFEEGGVQWSALFFVDNINPAREARRASLAAERGFRYVSRLMPDMTMLDPAKPDYVIYAKPGEDVPEELIEELEAVHHYYASHEEALKIAWQRRQALAVARRAWLEAHPPQPKDTVINFWPVRSSLHGHK